MFYDIIIKNTNKKGLDVCKHQDSGQRSSKTTYSGIFTY